MSALTPDMRLGPVLRSWMPVLAAIVLAACAAGPGGSSGGGDSWTEVSAATALAGVSLLDVTSFGPGFVAVGNAPVAGTLAYGGAFTSTDGSTWAAAPTEPFKATTVSVVGKVSKGLLALGSACSVECGGFGSWLSADGVTWTAPAFQSGDTSRPTGFAEHGSTIAAIATELVDPSLNHYQGSVSISSDGATWTAHPNPQTFDNTGLAGIATDGNGFVIVGSNLLESGTRDGAAWTSSDGMSWTAGSDDGSFKGALLQAVAHGAGGYVAVGSVGGDGAVWTSARWHELGSRRRRCLQSQPARRCGHVRCRLPGDRARSQWWRRPGHPPMARPGRRWPASPACPTHGSSLRRSGNRKASSLASRSELRQPA